jgi:hypothetical protein
VLQAAVWGDSLAWAMAKRWGDSPGYAFYNGAALAASADQTALQVAADTTHRDWINIIWCGSVYRTDTAATKRGVAAAISNLPTNGRFLVLSPHNATTTDPFVFEPPAHDQIVQVNRELAQLYPDNFVDTRGYLIDRYNPAIPQDVLDRANDVPPSSLRFDMIHLNDDGYLLVAQLLKEIALRKGWL